MASLHAANTVQDRFSSYKILNQTWQRFEAF